MPCQGPSQEYAFEQEDKFFQLIKKQLKSEGIQVEPSKYPYNFANLKNEQIRNFIELENVIKEIFWTDECLNF